MLRHFGEKSDIDHKILFFKKKLLLFWSMKFLLLFKLTCSTNLKSKFSETNKTLIEGEIGVM